MGSQRQFLLAPGWEVLFCFCPSWAAPRLFPREASSLASATLSTTSLEGTTKARGHHHDRLNAQDPSSRQGSSSNSSSNSLSNSSSPSPSSSSSSTSKACWRDKSVRSSSTKPLLDGSKGQRSARVRGNMEDWLLHIPAARGQGLLRVDGHGAGLPRQPRQAGQLQQIDCSRCAALLLDGRSCGTTGMQSRSDSARAPTGPTQEGLTCHSLTTEQPEKTLRTQRFALES